MILRDPWDFAFSAVLMASDQPGIEFKFHTPRKARLSETKHAWLASAVLDGVRYDYDDDEFILVCSKRYRSLDVEIWNYEVSEDHSHRKFKRDSDGILWDHELSKRNAKSEKDDERTEKPSEPMPRSGKPRADARGSR